MLDCMDFTVHDKDLNQHEMREKNCKLENLVGFNEVGLDDVMGLLMSDHEALSNEQLIIEKESREEEGSEDRSCVYAYKYKVVQSCESSAKLQ